MKSLLAIAAASLCAVALAGQAAADDKVFTDGSGEVAGSLDVQTTTITNTGSKYLFRIRVANAPTWPADSGIVILFDTDRNASTGDDGFEYFFTFLDNQRWVLERWSGADWADSQAPAIVGYTGDGFTLIVDRADLGGSTAFDFAVATVAGASTGTPIIDVAPDQNVWTYELPVSPPPPAPVQPPATAPAKRVVLSGMSALFTSAHPVAGKRFAVKDAVVRVRGGGTVPADRATCKATLGGKPLAGGCAWKLPAKSHGKTLRVVVTGVYQGVKATRTYTFKVK